MKYFDVRLGQQPKNAQPCATCGHVKGRHVKTRGKVHRCGWQGCPCTQYQAAEVLA